MKFESQKPDVYPKKCLACGKEMERNKYPTGLEAWTSYNKRSYCNQACARKAHAVGGRTKEQKLKTEPLKQKAQEVKAVEYRASGRFPSNEPKDYPHPCLYCGKPKHRKILESGRKEAWTEYLRRKYCSADCAIAALRGEGEEDVELNTELLGKRLKELRLAKGYDVKEAATKIKMELGTLARLEEGKLQKPRHQDLIKLAGLYSVHWDTLMDGIRLTLDETEDAPEVVEAPKAPPVYAPAPAPEPVEEPVPAAVSSGAVYIEEAELAPLFDKIRQLSDEGRAMLDLHIDWMLGVENLAYAMGMIDYKKAKEGLGGK